MKKSIHAYSPNMQRLRQGCKFKASLGFIETLSLKPSENNQNRKQ